MNKRERVLNLVSGLPVDQVPTGFWHHFPSLMHHGDNAVCAHLEFARKSNSDILKIMNENLLCCGETKIRCTADLARIQRLSSKDRLFVDQKDIIKRIADKANGEYPLLATIHGLVASVFHATGFAGKYATMGYSLAIFCRENPQKMKDIFAMFADALAIMVDCSLDAGADGIFYAALGGERDWFLPNEYEEFVGGYEGKLYAYIKSRTGFDVLHICKAGIDFSRYQKLAPTVVNWSVCQNNVSLLEGIKLFPGSVVLGGFQDRSGVLIDGNKEEVERETIKILEQMKGQRFILGADCTLPAEISYERLHWVSHAVSKYSQYSGQNITIN